MRRLAEGADTLPAQFSELAVGDGDDDGAGLEHAADGAAGFAARLGRVACADRPAWGG